MKYSISTNSNEIDPQELISLYEVSGWGKKSDYSQKDIEKILQRSFCVFARNDNGNLIGFARALSDGVYDTFISEVLVHPKFRNKKIGQKLVGVICKKFQQTGVYLNSFKESEGFFIKQKFIKRDNMIVLSK